MTRLLLLTTALGLVAAPAAVAAPKPKPKPKPLPMTCRLAVDPPDDATGTAAGAAGPSDAGLDLEAVDLATSATELTVVFDVLSLSRFDFLAPAGRAYTATFTVNGKAVTVRAVVTPAEQTGNDWAGGLGRGVVDEAASQVRMTVPLAKLPLGALKADATRFTALSATAHRWAGPAASGAAVGDAVDTAGPGTTYVHRQRSCVRVGG